MPFTISHVAAALPFRRLKPTWPALVIGTLAPDFQYFLYLTDESRAWHEFPQVLTITAPAALLVFWLYEFLIKDAAIELLPTGVQQRLAQPQKLAFTDWQLWPKIVGWILVGITTHVLWDSFTHSTTWTYEHSPLLQTWVSVPFHSPMGIYKLLQYLSTVLGMLAVLGWIVFWYKTTPARRISLCELSTRRKLATVLIMTTVAVVVGYPLAVARYASLNLPIAERFFLVTFFEAGTLLFSGEILLYSLARTWIHSAQRMKAPVLRD